MCVYNVQLYTYYVSKYLYLYVLYMYMFNCICTVLTRVRLCYDVCIPRVSDLTWPTTMYIQISAGRVVVFSKHIYNVNVTRNSLSLSLCLYVFISPYKLCILSGIDITYTYRSIIPVCRGC